MLVNIRRQVGTSDFKNLIDKSDNRRLLLKHHIGNRQLLPIVWIKVDIAAAICSQEITNGGRIHHAEQEFHGKTAASLFKFFPLGQIWASRSFTAIARLPRQDALAAVAEGGQRALRYRSKIPLRHCYKGDVYILFYAAHVVSFLVLTVRAGHGSSRLILCMIFFAKSLKSRCASFAAAAWLPIAPSAVVR